MTLLTQWKEALFRKGFRRTWARYRNRVAHRTSEADFVDAFRRLDLPTGSTLMVHARLSSFGHLADGPESIIRALQTAVPGCTVVMPTFPFARTMSEYLDSDPLFDPPRTPSQSGLLSEAFRQMPHVKRSIHPTHPFAALGPRADEILDGSEHSLTPFGPSSAYGRTAALPTTYQVLLDTNSSSIVHVIQEQIGMPNLFLESPRVARGLDRAGTERLYEVKVHTPRTPLYVAVPEPGGSVQFVWMPDYCLLFPTRNRSRTYEQIRSPQAREMIAAREKQLLDQGVLRTTSLDSAEILSMHAKPWLDTLCAELATNISLNRQAYERAPELVPRAGTG